MEVKETDYKSILKSNIILFLSYSILTGFIFVIFVLIIKYSLKDIVNPLLSVTLSLMSGIIIFYLFRFSCKSSTITSFRDIKLSKENTEHFLQKMNLFFIICIMISIVACIGYLFMTNYVYSKAIANAYEKYNFISPQLTDKIVYKIYVEYKSTFPGKVLSTIIIELSLAISFFSLISYQKKIIEK